MNILVFGAGVVGSLYAGRLAAAGQDVALLARGARLAQLRREGLTLVDEASGEETSPRLRIVEEYLPDDIYDVVIVATRADQIAEVLPVLAANRRVSCVIFLQNCASGPANLIVALGRERVVLGFPGAGGAREDARVQYRLIPQQKTTLGEVSGCVTPRLHRIASVLQAAGFPVAFSRRMDAWLKTHAVLVTAIAGAIYLAEGTCANVASGADGVPRLVRAVRQGFHALRTAGVFIEPRKLAILFLWLPFSVPVTYWRRYFAQQEAELIFAQHVRSAGGEMRELVLQVQPQLRGTGCSMPDLNDLWCAVEKAPSINKST